MSASDRTTPAHQPEYPVLSFFNPASLDRADVLVATEPFHYLIANDQLALNAANQIRTEFPQFNSAGFFPWEANECGPNLNHVIGELTDPACANAIGTKLGVNKLGQYPTLVTLCRSLNKRHGTIHTDSKSKIITALLYLNGDWPDTDAGCLRLLSRIDDIDAIIAPPIKPIYGNLVAFKRADNSFHGHLPYAGERLVIQVAWLISVEEKLRKTQRGKLSRLFKKIFGGLDRKFGAHRDRNAAHRD